MLNDPAAKETSGCPRAWMSLLVVAAGVLLRWWQLGSQSLWFDEGYSAWVASLSPQEIVTVIRNDVSPPLYYLLLRGWRTAFGESELALRAMSATAGTLSLLVFVAIAARLFANRVTRLAALLLFAASVLQIQFSQEARSYGIASLFALLSLWGMLVWLQQNSRPGLALAVAAAGASVWLHNMMWFYLAGLNAAWLLAASPQRWRRRLLSLMLLDLLVVLAYLPWVPSLLGQMAWLKGNFWASVPGAGDLLQILSATAGGKVWHLSRVLYGIAPGMAGHLWLATAVAAGLLGVALSTLRGETRRNAAAMTAYALLPIFAVFLHAQSGQSYFIEKIFTASAAVLPLSLAAALETPWRRTSGILLVALMAMACLSTWGYLHWEQKEEWRQAVREVNARRPELVVFVANEGEYLYDYYTRQAGLPALRRTGAPQSFFDLQPPRTIQRVQSSVDLHRLTARLEQENPASVMLVFCHADWSDPQRLTPSLLRGRYAVEETMFFKDLSLHHFTRR